MNFSQLNRTKANLGSCLLWDSNNTSLDDGIKSRASTEGTELSSGSLPGGGGTARWGFHCSFALGHALLFQLNLWCTESLVLFFCHLILMERSLFLREITLGSENHSPPSLFPSTSLPGIRASFCFILSSSQCLHLSPVPYQPGKSCFSSPAISNLALPELLPA